MAMNKEKTIHHGVVGYYMHRTGAKTSVVTRKSRSQRDKCKHLTKSGKRAWKSVTPGYRGHGKWGYVCCLCGALARG